MKIYHNAQCSKSLTSLDLLHEKGVYPEVINYLETPPTKEELKTLLQKLGISAYELMRKKRNHF